MKKILVSLMLVLGLVAFAAESAPSETVGYIKYSCVKPATKPTGLNFISIPVDAGYTMVSQLDAGTTITQANYWDATNQGWVAADNYGGGFWFPDFAVTVGMPVMVNVATDYDVIMDGPVVATTPYNLIKPATKPTGLNSIQHPLEMSSFTMISQLGDDIGSCSQANEWDATNQGWVAADNYGGGFWFPDYATEIGKASMVNMTADVVWPGAKGEEYTPDGEIPSLPKSGISRSAMIGVVNASGVNYNFPTDNFVTFKMWITGRESEIVDQTTAGSTLGMVPGPHSVIIGNIGNFDTPWADQDELNVRPKDEGEGTHLKVYYESTTGDVVVTIPDATTAPIQVGVENWIPGTGAPIVLGLPSSIDGNMPLETKLEQNYPNPFNPTTTINFSLKNEGVVKLNVYNYTGQLVNSLVNGQMNAGHHTVNFDASNLSAGVYYYTLEADSKVMTNKMVLIK